VPSSANVKASTVRNSTHAGSGFARAIAIVSGFTSVASQRFASRAACGVHQPVPHATSSPRRPANTGGSQASIARRSSWRSGLK
jgi:hypothetical protein